MTPVGVFFICENEVKCDFVNSTKMSRSCEERANAGTRRRNGAGNLFGENGNGKQNGGNA